MIAEPPRKGRRSFVYRRRPKPLGERCLNCGEDVTTPYCPQCGQENAPPTMSVGAIFKDAFEEFLRFDSKLTATVIPLVVRPGFLTTEWSKGKRVRYLSPLKLYLTVTFLFFLVGSLASTFSGESSAPTKARKGVKVSSDIDRDLQKADHPALRFILKSARKAQVADERALVNALTENVPQVIFMLLPVYSAVLWVLYIRSRRYYVEHLVFALHVHAFYFLALTMQRIAPYTVIQVISWIAIPIYSLLALKGAYGQGWLKTMVKSAILGFSYLFLFSVGAFLTFIMAAASLPDVPEVEPAKPPVTAPKKP